MSAEDDERFMRHAIDASELALREGNLPFGAALVKAGVVRHVARNNQITASDPLGHAEVVLVREVLSSLGASALQGGSVFASGEPCAMCTGAMFWAGITRVVYAADQHEIIVALGGPQLPIRSAQVLTGASPAVRVDGPVLGAEAFAILKRYGARG
jgi:tRNA(Arg) A34 adenosine deaminase TadA